MLVSDSVGVLAARDSWTPWQSERTRTNPQRTNEPILCVVPVRRISSGPLCSLSSHEPGVHTCEPKNSHEQTQVRHCGKALNRVQVCQKEARS